MLNSIAKNAQTVATNQNVLFTETAVDVLVTQGGLHMTTAVDFLKSQTVEICQWRSKLSLTETLRHLQ